MSWRWITKETVLAIHDEQLAEHGGDPGLRSESLLDSALDRPKNKAHYEYPSLAQLAAAYAFGLVKNHPFVDGNKRTGAVVSELFLALHGAELTATDRELVASFEALADGQLSEEELTSFFVVHSRPVADESEDDFLRSEDARE
jgi:death-on-curing protein